MNIVQVDPANGNTGLTKGNYMSMFFIKCIGKAKINFGG
jgi:hypothetical protein